MKVSKHTVCIYENFNFQAEDIIKAIVPILRDVDVLEVAELYAIRVFVDNITASVMITTGKKIKFTAEHRSQIQSIPIKSRYIKLLDKDYTYKKYMEIYGKCADDKTAYVMLWSKYTDFDQPMISYITVEQNRDRKR